jgi:hypothetical protein
VAGGGSCAASGAAARRTGLGGGSGGRWPGLRCGGRGQLHIKRGCVAADGAAARWAVAAVQRAQLRATVQPAVRREGWLRSEQDCGAADRAPAPAWWAGPRWVGLRRGGRCCGVANRASEARRTVHLRCGRGCCTADGAAVRRAKLLSGGWNVCGAANGRKGSGCCVAAADGTSAWRREPLLYSPRPSHGQYNQDLFL